MQKEYRKNSVNPFRLMSDRYLGCVRDIKEGDKEGGEEEAKQQTHTIKNFFFSSGGGPESVPESTIDPFQQDLLLAPSVVANTKATDSSSKSVSQSDTFAQRYIDEVAPRGKMLEYEAVAVKQKEVLVKEARLLKVRYSEDIQESQKMERTMNNITSMIGEFVQLVESQSVNVDTIGEVTKDTTASVKNADAELLLTLERSQSHQWSMIAFILGMAFLLLLLDALTP